MRTCRDLKAKDINWCLWRPCWCHWVLSVLSCVFVYIREGGRVHPHIPFLGIDVTLLTICTPLLLLLPANKCMKLFEKICTHIYIFTINIRWTSSRPWLCVLDKSTSTRLEKGQWCFYVKDRKQNSGVGVQRWNDGREYKMLLKEIEIRAIRWCRLAVCMKTHPVPALWDLLNTCQIKAGLHSKQHTLFSAALMLRWNCYFKPKQFLPLFVPVY